MIETIMQLIMTAIAVMSPAEVSQLGLEKTAPIVREAKIKRTLREGDCGADVRNLNRELRSFRFANPRGECFDEKTKISVEAFQRYSGLESDSIVGPQTRKKLQKTKKLKLSQIPGWKDIKNDIRGNYFLFSLEKQMLFVVRDGRIRFATIASSGKPGYDTPKGTYSVYLKDPMSWSNPYSVWMPWAVYFNGGIAMHQSDSVPAYPASHGCVRLPSLSAEKVYNYSAAGDTVVVL